MALDIRTIVFLGVITYLLCTLFIVQLWWQNRNRFDGLGYWAANFVLQTLGLGLIAARGTVPDWVSIALANAILLAGAVLVYIGLERFLRKTGLQWHNYLLLALCCVALAYFSLIRPDLSQRALLIAVFYLVLCLQCLWLLWFRWSLSYAHQHGLSARSLPGIACSASCASSIIFLGRHCQANFSNQAPFKRW